MPDESERKALRKARFREAKSCVTCLHADVYMLDSGWGKCMHPDAKYKHGKNTEHRHIRCHMGGVCRRWERGDAPWLKTIRDLIASIRMKVGR